MYPSWISKLNSNSSGLMRGLGSENIWKELFFICPLKTGDLISLNTRLSEYKKCIFLMLLKILWIGLSSEKKRGVSCDPGKMKTSLPLSDKILREFNTFSIVLFFIK